MNRKETRMSETMTNRNDRFCCAPVAGLLFLSWIVLSGCQTYSAPNRIGWLRPPEKRAARETASREKTNDHVVRGQQNASPFTVMPATTLPPEVPLTAASTVLTPPPPTVSAQAAPPTGSAFIPPTTLQPENTPTIAPPPRTTAPSIWDSITPEQVEPLEPSLLPGHNPWSLPSTVKSEGVSIEEAAKKEEMAREKARLMEMSRNRQHEDLPKHLKPLPHWAGRFEERVQSNGEQGDREIIQASHLMEQNFTPIDPKDLYDWEKEQKKEFDWDSLDPARLYTKVRDWSGFGSDEKKAIALMDEGREILKGNRDLKDRTKNLQAAKKFEQAAQKWPNSVLAEDSLYLAAECYFFADYYPKAMTHYQKLIINYHHSKHLDTSVRRLFDIGKYWEAKSRKASSMTLNLTDKSLPANSYFGNAKKAYETIFLYDTNGPISDDAVMALATAYLVRGQRPGDAAFDQAAYYYAFLREHYPNSSHIVKARELELYALTNTFHGAGYNTKSLEVAGRLAEQTLRQHAHEMSIEDKQEIMDLKESVLDKEAASAYETARYYQKRKDYGAARKCFEELIRQYPQTNYAADSQKQLQLMAGKPDQPARFDWFGDLLDSSRKAKKADSEDDLVADDL